MEGPFRLVVVSDAAYKWEEPEKPYARRGEFLLLMQQQQQQQDWHQQAPSSSLCGKAHILGFQSKKIARVTKSTFAAEIMSLTSALDNGEAMVMQYEQIMNPQWDGTRERPSQQQRLLGEPWYRWKRSLTLGTCIAQLQQRISRCPVRNRW